MTNPKESLSKKYKRVQYGTRSSLRQREKAKKKKKKKIPPNRMVQQFLKLLTNTFKKSQQFSQKKYKKVKMRFLVTWLLQNWKPVLFWRLAFKPEVNNLIFKHQMPTKSPIQPPRSTFQHTTPPSQIISAVFIQNTNGRSFDYYDTSMNSN